MTRVKGYEPWANQETEIVDRWFMRPRVNRGVIALVIQWNQLELLGVDLARQLKSMVYEKAVGNPKALAILSKVNWNQIAEQYALRFCGVDEDTLAQRRDREMRKFVA